MKKITISLFVVVATVVLLGCSSSSSFQYSSYTPKQKPDFSKFKTFAFMDFTTKKQLSEQMLSGLLTVEASVAEQMQQRGYTQVQRTANPDLLINLGTFLSKKTEYTESFVAIYPEQNVYYWGAMDYATHYDPVVYQSNIKTITYDEGTLLVDLIDAKNSSLAWHGAISHVFTGTENVNRQNLDKQIILLFNNEFPKIGK